MKKKRSVLHDLLFVSISSFIVVAFWIGFNLYHTWVTTTIAPEMQIQITSISPDFDTATLQQLKSRKQVTPITTLSGKKLIDIDTTPSPTPAQPLVNAPTPLVTSANIAPSQQQTNIPVTVQGE